MHLDAKTFARKLWVPLAVVAGIVVVFLSWRVPEPETHGPRPSPLVDTVSYMQLVPAQEVAPAPNYGARTE